MTFYIRKEVVGWWLNDFLHPQRSCGNPWVVENIFTVMKWFLCFLKSQSEIEMDWRWFDFTLTFWRNEKVNYFCENIFVVQTSCLNILYRDITLQFGCWHLAWTHFTAVITLLCGCKQRVYNHCKDITLWMVKCHCNTAAFHV